MFDSSYVFKDEHGKRWFQAAALCLAGIPSGKQVVALLDELARVGMLDKASIPVAHTSTVLTVYGNRQIECYPEALFPLSDHEYVGGR